jgi:S-adenosylmethionine synthetase
MVTAFGYACSGNDRAMPLPILVAHEVVRALDKARSDGRLAWLSPDAQAQVAVRFENRKPIGLSAVALTAGTQDDLTSDTMREALLAEAIEPALKVLDLEMEEATRFVFVPVRGETGPDAHSGLTGRKSADDCYGSFIRRSGSALSGKDPSRIDRIASYAARQAARAVVAAGLALECELQLSYIVGDEAPASVEVDTFESGRIADAKIGQRVRDVFDFRVAAIAERMGLWDIPSARNGHFYRDLARYGHMGRDDLTPPWEDVSIVQELL